jgi:transposase
MPPVDRKNPKRATSSESQYSLMEFMREFPNDDACLEWLWRNRFSQDGKHADCPKCERIGVPFKKYATKQRRQTWTCTKCGHHLQPTAGTIFHGSSTSLHLWFFAIHLVTSTRVGLSAKQLEREIGVTYKTAWRMLNLIRNDLMAQDEIEPLSGEVEADETYVGGKPRAAEIRRFAGRPGAQSKATRLALRKKSTVFGMVERGGKVRAMVVPSNQGQTLKTPIYTHVLPSSSIFTDEYPAYKGLERRYRAHYRIRHKERIYVDGNVHTNTIEGFFSNLKRGIGGTYHSVSKKWLQSYLNEYVFRYNARRDDEPMFVQLLLRSARS